MYIQNVTGIIADNSYLKLEILVDAELEIFHYITVNSDKHTIVIEDETTVRIEPK